MTSFLRLTAKHATCDDPDDFVAEVKIGADGPFMAVAEFSRSVYEVLNPEDFDDVWDDLPAAWTEEFRALLEMWAEFNDVGELAPAYPDLMGNPVRNAIASPDPTQNQ